jgi:type II secretory pathway component PulK
MRAGRKVKRSGATLIVALVAVAIFTSLAATNIRSVLRHRQAVKSERNMIQTQLLCEAGCDRVASMFASNREYAGEVWLDQQDPSTGLVTKVDIRMERKDGKAIAIVQASLGGLNQSPQRIQRTRHIVLSASPEVEPNR